MRSIRPREVVFLPFRYPVLFLVALAFTGILYVANLQAGLYDVQNPRWVITMAVLLLLSPLFAGLFILLVRQVERDGGRTALGLALSRTIALYGPLVVGEIVVNLGVALGMVLFILPGVYLGLRWSLYKQAILVDGRRALHGMRASFATTQGGRTLIELFVWLSACYAPTLAFGYASSALPMGVGIEIAFVVLSTLTFAWTNTYLTLRYLRSSMTSNLS